MPAATDSEADNRKIDLDTRFQLPMKDKSALKRMLLPLNLLPLSHYRSTTSTVQRSLSFPVPDLYGLLLVDPPAGGAGQG